MIITKIKKKQKEILLLLLRFRALTSKQTQTLLHHKNHKRINIWLTDLVDKNYIGKIKEERSPGQNKPAIYYLEKDGLIFLKDLQTIEKSNLNKMRNEREKKSDFFTKCHFIVDTYIHLLNQSKINSYILKFYTPNDFSIKAKIRELMPSFAYVKEKNGKREQFTCEFIHSI